MQRRRFLIGLGALLTAPYVSRVATAVAAETSFTPLISEEEAHRTLIARRNTRGFQLYFADTEPPPQMTYREVLAEYYGEHFSGKQLSKVEQKQLNQRYELEVPDLDAIAPVELYRDEWNEKNDPGDEAFRFLEGLYIGPEEEEGENLIGELNFIEGEFPGSTYYAVEAPDELTLHLLQARLLELGERIFIRIEKG